MIKGVHNIFSCSSLYIKLSFWFGTIVSKSFITQTLGSLTQRTEDIDMALEQIDEAEKVLQDAQKRLQGLLNSIRENQK